jgi:hypothetical protein
MKRLIEFSTATLLFIALLLTGSCAKDNGTNNQYPDITANADTIYGTLKYKPATGTNLVVDWPFGTATFKIIVGVSDVLASAAVNADGTFMLVLPATVSGTYFSSLADVASTQGGSIKATPETIRILSALLYKVDYNDNGTPNTMTTNLYTLKSDFSIDKSYFYNFYDSEGTFTGTGTNGNVFDWTFTKGWGMVESFVISSSSEAFNSKSVDASPANAVWVNY